MKKALPSVRKLFTHFSKHVLQMFVTFLGKKLTKNWLHGRDSHTPLTIVGGGYVVGSHVQSSDFYDQKTYSSTEPEV